MDELIKRKSELQDQLDSYEESSEMCSDEIKNQIKNLEAQKQQKQKILDIKIQKLKELQFLIADYKHKNTKKHEKEIKLKYEKIIQNVNKLTFCDFERDYNNLKKYDRKNKKFTNLNERIRECMQTTRNEYKKKIVDELLENLNEPLHILSIKINSIIEYENVTNENVFVMLMVSRICESVLYHFLTNKETNRLDKPEWFFDYFLVELKENKRFLVLYENLCEAEEDVIDNKEIDGVEYKRNADNYVGNSISKNNIEKNNISNKNNIEKNNNNGKNNINNKNINGKNNIIGNVKKNGDENRNEHIKNRKYVYRCIFERMSDLIFARFNEILKSESKQKINLMLHFCDELKIFKNTLKNEFNTEIDTKRMCENLLKTVKEDINKKMEEVHLGNYKKWFIEYKKMLKDCFDVYLSLYDLDETLFFVVCQHIIDNIYIYCDLFVNQMRYLCREEIHLLCLIFSEIEKLKAFVIEQESEHDLMLVSEKQINIQKLSKFNGDNLKLIKSLAKNDINNILKRIRNIKYVPQKTLIDFNIDLTQILNEYEKYLEKGYKIFNQCIAEQIDDFLVQNIILKNNFSSEEYFEFKEFYRKIYEHFKTYKNWKTITACKCIEDIFNGRVPENECDDLFSLIYKNYENE